VPPRDFASWRNPCGGNKIVLLHSLAGKSSLKSSAKFPYISHASHVHYELYIPLARLVGVHMSCWLFARLFQNCQVTATHKQGNFESNGQLCLYGDNSQNSNCVRTGFVPFFGLKIQGLFKDIFSIIQGLHALQNQ